MIVGLDGTPLTIPFPCGTKHYAEQLISAFARIDKKNEYIIFSKKNVRIPSQKNFHLVKIPTYTPILKRQFFLYYFAKKANVNIFHHLEPFGSLFINKLKIVTTVHDLDLSQIFPKVDNPQKLFHRLYTELIRWQTIKNTTRFIAISNDTKNQLASHLKKRGLDTPIKVISEAPSSKFRVVDKYKKATRNYFLCMGDYSPRKNIHRIYKAYSKLDPRIKERYKLKTVISTVIIKDNLYEIAENLKIDSSLELIVSPNLGKLVKLFNHAKVFLYPSLYEGFGLPILEAMACGCPVITSSYGAMKETAGDAAYLINPKSTVEITTAMERIATNSRLESKLRARSLQRVKLYSWEKTARETLQVYEKVYQNGK